ncbi:hypothetical protein MMC10_005028 [Thelotrema lepadinum]|nr:hypothetical protein [Thelotrema lepadinum]
MTQKTAATPIIIGVGDVQNRSLAPDDAVEPMQLMLHAIHKAIEDTGLESTLTSDLRAAIDSIDVVRTWTWPYEDLPGLLGINLGASLTCKSYSDYGGNEVGRLIDEAARRVSQRKSKFAVVTGGEALASLSTCANAKRMPPTGWTKPSADIASSSPLSLAKFGENAGTLHSAGLPVHVYPMYENAFRAHHRQSIKDNKRESAKLYADFAKIAADNKNSWNYGKPPATESDIATVSKSNRMICSPYPLLMNAFNAVNLSGACLLTSTEFAEEIGVPMEKWIYLLGGAGTKDSVDFWQRPNFFTSPSISRSLDAALEVSGLAKDMIDLYDFYSCFPIVPKLACRHLGLPLIDCPKPITLLGGLTSFGGAGSNYSMHAVTEMVRQLRSGKGQNGLVLANGGVVSYQHVICLSSQSRQDSRTYPVENPLPDTITDMPVPSFTSKACGAGVVETYTVEYNRDGSPKVAHIVGRLRVDGSRFISNHGDFMTLQQLLDESFEPIGMSGHVRNDSGTGRNLFTFSPKESRL